MADTVRIDEAAQAVIAEYAEKHGVSLARAATILITTPPAPSQPAMTLDTAAEVMLKHLPAALVDRVRDLAREYRVSPAAYLLGYAKLAHDQGRLSIRLDADDRALGTAMEPIPVPETATCEYCKATFAPTRIGQKYCPEPEDWNGISCGRKALLDEVHKRRPPESQRTNKELARHVGR